MSILNILVPEDLSDGPNQREFANLIKAIPKFASLIEAIDKIGKHAMQIGRALQIIIINLDIRNFEPGFSQTGKKDSQIKYTANKARAGPQN